MFRVGCYFKKSIELRNKGMVNQKGKLLGLKTQGAKTKWNEFSIPHWIEFIVGLRNGGHLTPEKPGEGRDYKWSNPRMAGILFLSEHLTWGHSSTFRSTDLWDSLSTGKASKAKSKIHRRKAAKQRTSARVRGGREGQLLPVPKEIALSRRKLIGFGDKDAPLVPWFILKTHLSMLQTENKNILPPKILTCNYSTGKFEKV